MKKQMKIRRKRRFRYRRELKAGLVIITLALFLILGVVIYRKQPLPVVTLTVSDAEMRAEEAIPAMTVSASSEEDGKLMLDRKNKYRLHDLLNDLNSGKGYIVKQATDGTEEGDFRIEVVLNEEFSEKYENIWSKKISFEYKEGNLLVRNKYGDWDGDLFVLLDGTYAKGWLDIKDDTYYFGDDNVKYTGEQVIGGRTYYFDEEGRFDKEKNLYNPTKPVVALTFDDGPSQYTMGLLEFLEEQGAKATFFMLGSRVSTYPDEIKKMVEIGCELGNHSLTHLQLTKGSNADIAHELQTTDHEIKKVAGEESTLIRPPYGSCDDRVKSIAGKPMILWSLDTLDWDYRDVEKIKNEIRTTIKDGDVVLMHDIYETSVQSIKEMILELKEEGYQFVTVSELAEIRNVELKAGESYRSFYK